MKQLVAIVILSAAITSSVAAGPSSDEVMLTAQQCAALPVSAYQAIARLGIQTDGYITTPDHPSMTLTPGQVRSLQVGDGVD
ncbi:hypothetical protein [Bosea sp. AS-1]|uniref:hypothetical protein n=1 Tax=Bosea sp. AS-1 TaxID=2015316 RepID=UPI0012FD3B63|nr:hypothetical protein [Bosea sp. AS-1]